MKRPLFCAGLLLVAVLLAAPALAAPPEALDGGPIGRLRDGDVCLLDLETGVLEARVGREAADEIEDDEPGGSEHILDIVAEDPQVEHVSAEM